MRACQRIERESANRPIRHSQQSGSYSRSEPSTSVNVKPSRSQLAAAWYRPPHFTQSPAHSIHSPGSGVPTFQKRNRVMFSQMTMLASRIIITSYMPPPSAAASGSARILVVLQVPSERTVMRSAFAVVGRTTARQVSRATLSVCPYFEAVSRAPSSFQSRRLIRMSRMLLCTSDCTAAPPMPEE